MVYIYIFTPHLQCYQIGNHTHTDFTFERNIELTQKI